MFSSFLAQSTFLCLKPSTPHSAHNALLHQIVYRLCFLVFVSIPDCSRPRCRHRILPRMCHGLVYYLGISFPGVAANKHHSGCLGKADPGSCSMQDNACLCANPTFVQGTFDCFKSACSVPADFKQAYDFSSSLCKQAVSPNHWAHMWWSTETQTLFFRQGVSSTVVAPPRRTAIPEPIQRRAYPPVVK